MFQDLDDRLEVVALPALEFYQAVTFVDPKPGRWPIFMSAIWTGAVMLPLWALAKRVTIDNRLAPFGPICFRKVWHLEGYLVFRSTIN